MQGQHLISQLSEEISKVIKGKEEAILMILTVLLAQGHVLIEDVPGVGKTTLAMALGKATGLGFRRAQFTPDVMASDITGFTMFNKEENRFEYRSGLVMTNILLADEINRTSPKTQSALLEAMEEGKVTVDGVTRELPRPFTVIATQNPVGSIGTQMLPESQLDRFMFCVSMGYPTVLEEIIMLKGKEEGAPLERVEPVVSIMEVEQMKQEAEQVFIHDEVYEYIVKLVHATRKSENISLGISPRGSVSITRAARAAAYLKGKDYVSPQEVQEVFADACAHRILLSSKARANRKNEMDVIRQIMQKVVVGKRR